MGTKLIILIFLIVRFQNELEEKKAEPAEMEQEIERFKAEILQEAKRRGKLVAKYQKVLELYVNKLVSRNQASLRSLSSHGKLESMKAFAKSQKLLLNEAQKLYEQGKKAHTHIIVDCSSHSFFYYFILF